MIKHNLLRIQVLPHGLVIGHIFPDALGNGIEPGDVLQIDANVLDTKTVFKVGKADFPMNEMMGIDRFLVEAKGHHLTVGGK